MKQIYKMLRIFLIKAWPIEAFLKIGICAAIFWSQQSVAEIQVTAPQAGRGPVTSTASSIASSTATSSGTETATSNLVSSDINKPFEDKIPPPELSTVPLQALAKLQKSSITFNESTRFEVELILKSEHEVLPFYIGPALKELRVINSGEQESPSPLDKTIRKKYWFEIEPIVEGQYLIPAIKIAYKIKTDKMGRTFEAHTKGLFLQVGADPEAAKNMEDFLDNETVAPIYWTRTKIIVLSFLIALFGAIGAAYYVWQKRKKMREEQIKMVLPPWDIAAQALLKLQNQLGSESPLSDRLFCFELSEIFRRYLDGIYSWNTIDKTFEEIRPVLRQSNFFPQQELGASQSFLMRTDEIKFTSLVLNEKERITLFEFVANFVNLTKPNLETQKGEGNS